MAQAHVDVRDRVIGSDFQEHGVQVRLEESEEAYSPDARGDLVHVITQTDRRERGGFGRISPGLRVYIVREAHDPDDGGMLGDVPGGIVRRRLFEKLGEVDGDAIHGVAPRLETAFCFHRRELLSEGDRGVTSGARGSAGVGGGFRDEGFVRGHDEDGRSRIVQIRRDGAEQAL